MEHIFLVDPIGQLPEKPVCLKRLSSLTGWEFSTGLFRSIHILLGFPSSSRPCTIYFRFFPILWEMESACSERDFPIDCVPFAQFETRWVFDINGKQPQSPHLTTDRFAWIILSYVILSSLYRVSQKNGNRTLACYRAFNI